MNKINGVLEVLFQTLEYFCNRFLIIHKTLWKVLLLCLQSIELLILTIDRKILRSSIIQTILMPNQTQAHTEINNETANYVLIISTSSFM